eukprot:CAMPEP_0173186966 /NCGR_PEP_ID=MMETSP1141-20130122/10434_1 /TAXON_ID=483371 /ORGANISM="non described non described, Strain CCMP2298" /LENGTH=45 /DNA_ID= /DNA_START= /DNA_END= /DNA_ORIENTATION=
MIREAVREASVALILPKSVSATADIERLRHDISGLPSSSSSSSSS